MIYYLLGSFFLISVFFTYKYLIKPKRQLVVLKSKLQQLGYKVQSLPFRFLNSGFDYTVKRDFTTHKDALATYKMFALQQVDIILHNILDQVVIQLASTTLIKQVLKPEQAYNLIKYKLLVAPLILRMGTGIAFKQQQAWKQRRKHINQVFNFGFILSKIPQFLQICDKKMLFMESQSARSQNGNVKLVLLNLFIEIFSNILISAFFGNRFQKQKIKDKPIAQFFLQIFKELFDQCYLPQVLFFGAWITNIPFLRNFKQVKKRAQFSRQFACEFIKKRVEQIKNKQNLQQSNDLIEALLSNGILKGSQGKNQNNQSILTIEDLVDQYCTFYIAGTDTTSKMMSHLISHVALNPKIQERLRNQINQYIIGKQSDFSIENLKKLKYIDWLQNQSLRMAGVGNILFWRQAVNDHYIGDIAVQKGQIISVNLFCNHYNPKYFKDPFQFRPQRWERQCDNIPPFAFTAFSGGPRNCLGKQLALIQSKIVIIKFMKRYQKITLPVNQLAVKIKFGVEIEEFETQLTLAREFT